MIVDILFLFETRLIVNVGWNQFCLFLFITFFFNKIKKLFFERVKKDSDFKWKNNFSLLLIFSFWRTKHQVDSFIWQTLLMFDYKLPYELRWELSFNFEKREDRRIKDCHLKTNSSWSLWNVVTWSFRSDWIINKLFVFDIWWVCRWFIRKKFDWLNLLKDDVLFNGKTSIQHISYSSLSFLFYI